MPDRPRRRTPSQIRELIAGELAAARTADDPWPALERAHIASQPWAWPHTRVHAAMLRATWRQRDRHELVAQLVRLTVAAPGSLTGRYPAGNTGRSTMRLTETAPVPDDLARLLPPD
jgi:hypothetical protein